MSKFWSLIDLDEIQFKCIFWLTKIYNMKNERIDKLFILQNTKNIFLQHKLETSILWVWYGDKKYQVHRIFVNIYIANIYLRSGFIRRL